MPSWFSQYPNFVHDPHAPLQDEFNRLAQERNWKVDGTRYRKEWRRCVEDSFTGYFGSDASRLEGWQALCIKVSIADVPPSITGCRKVSDAASPSDAQRRAAARRKDSIPTLCSLWSQALRGVWVNIVDLIDANRTGRRVPRHGSMNALRKYIMDTGKIFPKEAAKQNGFLKAFLITVFGA